MKILKYKNDFNLESLFPNDTYEDWCARGHYQGQGQVITSHIYCGM